MSRPLFRGILGVKISENINSLSKVGNYGNGFSSDPLSIGNKRNQNKSTLLFLRMSLAVIVFLTILGPFWWIMSIATSTNVQIVRNNRQLEEQLVSDWDIGKVSLRPSRSREVEFCPQESEFYVPCYNVTENDVLGYSDGSEQDPDCERFTKQRCLVLPPVNYRVPLRWPAGRDVIWSSNVKIKETEVLSSGSLTKRMMKLDDDQLTFHSPSLLFDGIEDYSNQIAEMMGLRNETSLIHLGVRTILDVGCGYGGFGVHLFSQQLLTLCIANYEETGSQVQISLERGLPAIIGSFTSKQLPFPSLSFDMLHCARCGIDWDYKDGIFLIEGDRVLKPGGYFVWTSTLINANDQKSQRKCNFIFRFAENICWEKLSQQDETIVWRKTTDQSCYRSRGFGSIPSICGEGVESPYYQPLQSCIGGNRTQRWIPIKERGTWPSRSHLNNTELAIYGLHSEEFTKDVETWSVAVSNYWSLLSPLLFSDHPKRLGEEDPCAPYNMIRNVLDMNAHFGGFNSALLEAGKSVWVMNVVPVGAANYLPMILDRGFVGVLHDWCEAFPSYPRTYDLVHAEGLLSLEARQLQKCSLLDLLVEIDRLLRPEGWVILRDRIPLIETARVITILLKWDSRIVEIENNSEERLLICQKPFIRRQAS